MRWYKPSAVSVTVAKFTGCDRHQTVTAVESFVYSLELAVGIKRLVGGIQRWTTDGDTFRDPPGQRMQVNVLNTHTHTHTHPFNGPFRGLPRWAGTRKVKPIWILPKQETVSGSVISWAICHSAPRSRQITTPAPHHSVFTGRMPFLPPNQQRQSTEGTSMFWIHGQQQSISSHDELHTRSLKLVLVWARSQQKRTKFNLAGFSQTGRHACCLTSSFHNNYTP